MTTDNRKRIAVDSCVFVNVLIGGEPNNPERYPAGVALLRAAEQGQFDVYISAVTVAEVCGAGEVRGAHVEKARRAANVASARQWIADGRFHVVELDHSLARIAGELAIEHQLKGPDAVVLASALRAKADTLYTWDDHLLNVDGRMEGSRVTTPSKAAFVQDLFSADEHHTTSGPTARDRVLARKPRAVVQEPSA